MRLKNSELAVSVEIVVWKTSPPTLRKTLSLLCARFFEVDIRVRYDGRARRVPPERARRPSLKGGQIVKPPATMFCLK